MAKYVGKIFKASNTSLGIHSKEPHYLKVQWYNPKNKTFLCRVITSLEYRYKDLNLVKKSYIKNSVIVKDKDEFCLLSKQKILKIRSGEITPIPIKHTKGFNRWSGFYFYRSFNINEIKNLKPKPLMYIKKKKHGI